MIIDSIENIECYIPLDHGLREVMDFLRRNDLETLPQGWHEVVPDSMRASVSNGPGRRRRGSRLESHRRHIDLQLILGGTDRMGWKPKSGCLTKSGGYDENTDVEFFDDEPDLWFKLRSGMFVIFYPEDAHMPQICNGLIHKIVFKLPITKATRINPDVKF